MSTFERFFQKQLGDEFLALAQRLEIAVANHCDDRHSTLDLVIQDGGLSLNAIYTLQFAQHVLGWTGNNLEISGYIFDELGATSSEELASLLFPRSQFGGGMRRNPSNVPVALTAEAVESLYLKFFEDQQLLVMLNCLVFTLLGNGNANDPELPKYVSQQMIKLDDQTPPPSDTDLAEGLEVFKSIIVLCRVVQDLEDVPLLHKAGFDSVRQITQQVKKDFSAKMVDVGMALENALRIHDCAESDFVPISKARPNILNPGGSPNRPLNNLTDIFKLEDSGCEECCSVTGLCAYLADLLLFLRNTKTPKINSPDRKSLEIYGSRNDTFMAQDLLQLLFSRRPDIRKLELTWANSQTLLPYISLVTEVLESYIRSVEVPPLAPSDLLEDSIRAYQTPASLDESGDEDSPEFQYRPANTDYEVYQKLISRPMYPLTNFPYDLSRDITLSAFGVWDIEFADFVRLFRSPEQLLARVFSAANGRIDESLREALEKGPEEILDRQYAAEVLGLQPAEFWAITNETSFPSAWTDVVNGLSPTALKIDKALIIETSALWGFDDDDEMLDVERGLSLIKNKLMANSGLTFQDIMDLPLTNDLAFQLQAFIRLRQKLKWSIADLDAAIVALRNLELGTVADASRPKRPDFLPRGRERERYNVSPLVRPDDEWQTSLSEIPAITPFVIKGIASLKRLSEISGFEPVELTVLWAPLNTYGDKSFFYRRFMTRRLQQIDSIFSLHKDISTGSIRFFTPEGIVTHVRDHSRGICAALNWPSAYFDSLVTAAGCTSKRLDIESFSSIYRYVLICKIIGVSAKQCKGFFDVFFAENPHILSSTIATVEAIERWKFLLASGWDIESLVDLLVKNRQVDENHTRAANEAAVRYVLEISSGARGILQSVPSAVPGSVQGVDHVADCANRIFDASVAQAVVELVENSRPLSQAVLIRMPLLQELSEALFKLPDAETLYISQPDSQDHDTDSDEDDEDSKQAAKLEAARLAAEKSSLEATIRLRRRRSTFIEFAIPRITEGLLDAFLVNSIQKALPDTEPALIPVLLHDLISIPTQDGEASQSALSALRDLTKPNSEAVTSECIDGYFSPPTSDVYTFSCSGVHNTTQPSLSVNNLDLQYDTDSESFTEIRLTVGKPYRLRCNIGNKSLTWSTTKASPSPLTEAVLMSTSIAARADLIIGTVKRIAQVCDGQCLTVDELQYIALNQNKPGQTLGLNFNKLTFTDLFNLSKYTTSWADATGWDKTRVLEALQAKFPDLSTGAVMSSLTDFYQFLNFADIMAFDEKLKISCTGGTLPTMFTRSKWSWMQHYTLWEAHRKLFLYPENWLEPSLRDDKSQLFEKVETVLMQKNLTVSTFLGAIQDYIYDLNGISSLDIVSYLHEPHKGAEDVFHLFGRTRTAPHTFYYRKLTVYATDRSVFWQPWTSIDLDIPSVEADWDSKRLQSSGAYLVPILLQDRLYIFFPQIAVTTSQSILQPSGSQSMTWTQMGSSSVAGQSPKTSWEITMAWSAYVKGSWSPKRISPGSLKIEPSKLQDASGQAQGQDRLPSAWEFRIDPLYEAKRVRLVISYAPETNLIGEVVGEFNFARDQVEANQDAKIALPRSQFSTRFGKVQGANSILFTPGFRDNMKDPLVWMPSDVAWKKEDINWTLSKTPYRMTGLVLNVREEDGSSRSYFNVPEKELLETRWTQEIIASRMKLRSIDHSFSERLMQAVANPTEPLDKIYNTLSTVPTDEWADCYGADIDVYYHELASPCALYNWELGVHSIMLAVDRFMSTQQFDEALQIARLLFDPTVDHQIDRQETAQPSCWKFPPFRDISDRIDDRRSYGQLAHAAARGRPQAYIKWIVIKYGEILLAAGDKHFCEGTLESLPLAIQRYVEAARVFGPEPVKGLKLSKRTAMCFEDVIKDEVRFYLDLPFTAQLKRNMDPIKGSASARDIDPNRETHRSFIMSSYFCVPLNPKFKKLRSLVHERLHNIRDSLDINGNPIVYALREPLIDPGALLSLNPGGAMGGDMAMVLADQNMPLTRYRFDVKINKALELCGELRSLADRFLAAIEKKEVEELNALRARNSTLIQGLMLEIKQTQLREAQQALESLCLSRESQVSQLSYFLETIGESSSLVPNSSQDWVDLVQDIGPITQDDMRMTAYEKAEMDLASTAAGLNIIAASIDQAAQVYAILPTMSANIQPFGVGCSISAGGSSIASAIQTGAMVMRTKGMIAAEESNQAGRKGRMARQLQDRRLQANVKGREIKATDKQIEMQKTRILAAEKEIESQRVSVEDAAQAEAYNRTKYTNQQLYAWIDNSSPAAQQAESSSSFEKGRKVSILKPSGYWNTSRDGLLAADNLYLDLRRLEALYLKGPRWDYEITKTVSLRQINPLALLRLRVNGSTDFSISEHQYDLDFPGHYMRRIRSVSVSIPAVISPHSSLNATLSLIKSQYRINSTAATAKEYLTTNSECHRSDRVPISSIAISSGANDAGAFELNFSGPKYLPFEGAGAISSWRLTLPCEIPKFDYSTISDVLLHIQYTSLDSGECLKAAANEAVRLAARSIEAEGKSEGFYAMLDLKHDFPNSWHAFKTSLISSYKATKTAKGSMELGDIRDRLPFWSRRQNKLVVQSIALVSKSAKLIRGTTIPLATGDDPVIDNGHLGTGRSSMAIKTFLDVSQDNLDGWVIETAGRVIEEKDQIVENMYMLVKYFFS
ncbi:toxin subunit [Fusarium subglutinans]|uniref:Toxin subunit n=1 Tax=Gibberella subglutinans TaxID=42677 RepID=A0A8H5KSU6_GIBSU|nr:toxin subunit [Fusarium subglutinans]KAF5578163.1 toxin subunit [Fusarium subglutinans]